MDEADRSACTLPQRRGRLHLHDISVALVDEPLR